ncbi:MAG: hypothetical protein B7X09_01205, partial [Acidiphilium sp. 21-66-27]
MAAVLGMMRKLELPRLLGRRASRERNLALALIAGRGDCQVDRTRCDLTETRSIRRRDWRRSRSRAKMH